VVAEELVDVLLVGRRNGVRQQRKPKRVTISAKPAPDKSVEVSGLANLGAKLPDELVVDRPRVYTAPLRDDRHRALAKDAKRGLSVPDFLEDINDLVDTSAHRSSLG
jgi:hypothetical protein